MKKWYQELYENSEEVYDKEGFVQGTEEEVDFIEKEVDYDKEISILDVGCGTGRHSIELARRGYRVTGIDLSKALLNKARQKASEAGVKVRFTEKDARALDFQKEFDLALILCEGAFSLMEDDQMDYRILEGISAALKDKAKFIMTTGNALFQLKNQSENGTFDILTLRETFKLEVTDDDGYKKELQCNQRYYLPSEISWRLKSLGFRKIEFFGCGEKGYSRNHKFSEEDFEMLIVAER